MAEVKRTTTNGGASPRAGRERLKSARNLSPCLPDAFARLSAEFRWGGVAKAKCVLAIISIPGIAIAQGTLTPAVRMTSPATESAEPTAGAVSKTMPAQAPTVSYVDGQLRIDVRDSTLAEVLAKVSSLTGVNIDVPATAGSERISMVELGPGPARQILASLFRDSDLDYLIQSSDTAPEKIQSVMLMPREKKGSLTNGVEAAARPSRNPFAKGATPPAPPMDAPVIESPEPAQPESVVAEATPLSPQPEPMQPDPSTMTPQALPDLSIPPTYGQPLQTNVPKTFPVPPPPSFNQQSISQQLQQMYQQRMQMSPQDQQVLPTNPGNR